MKLKDVLLSIAAGLLLAAILLFVIAYWFHIEEAIDYAMTLIMGLFVAISFIGFALPVREKNNKPHVSKVGMGCVESDSERKTITGYKRYPVKAIVVPFCDIDAENGYDM